MSGDGRRALIISTLAGGLGNQMFQYAAGRALALRHGTELVLDLGWLTPRSRFVYELGVFDLDVKLVWTYRHMRRARLRERLRLAPPVLLQDWKRDGFAFHPGVLALPADARLAGYWQSERYFADHAQTIRADFAFAEPLDARNEELADAIGASAAVAVHVRRGDYVTDPGARDFLGILPLDYYASAAAFVRRRVRSPHFFVFSDDPGWCRGHLRLGGPTTFVDHNAGRGYLDLRLMTLCRHHVIANSSFSWWGAWLAEPEGQRVVAPRRWGAQGEAGAVIPEWWHRL